MRAINTISLIHVNLVQFLVYGVSYIVWKVTCPPLFPLMKGQSKILRATCLKLNVIICFAD